MAILMRGGAYADFDPSKLRPREWAVVLENDPSARDGKAIYICFAAGMVKRISTYEDMKDDLISATEDIRELYVQALNEIKVEVERLANEASGFSNIAQEKAAEASSSAQVSTQKSESASASAANAANSADSSEEYSRYSESYAVGTNGEVRAGDEVDNSKYYKEECQRLYRVIERLIASVSSGGLIAAGTIPFEELPAEPQTNYMYNISNDFISDERFADGAGINYSRGTNIYWNVDGKWDVLTGISVLGVKGENETDYQTGYVNITKESLGLDGLKQVAYSGSYNDLIDKPGNSFGITKMDGYLKGEELRRDVDTSYYSAMSVGGGAQFFYIGYAGREANLLSEGKILSPGIYILTLLAKVYDLWTTDSRIPDYTQGFSTITELSADVGYYSNKGYAFKNICGCGNVFIRRGEKPSYVPGYSGSTETQMNIIFVVEKECDMLMPACSIFTKMPYNSRITHDNDARMKGEGVIFPLGLYKLG